MENVVNKNTAELEVNAWLDHKRISEKRREEKKAAIDSLIGFVEDGTVSINPETFEIKQNLKFEIGNQIKIKELIWKPFGNVGRVQIYMKNVDSADYTGNCIAHACAQTDQSKNIINSLDSEDTAVIKVIANFFM
jgi:hypothetical protein